MVREVTFDFQSVHRDLIRGDLIQEGGPGAIPRRPGIFRIFDVNGNLILLEKTHNLADRLGRFYRSSPRPGIPDLREITDRVEFCPTDSPFESSYLLYLERRRWFPDTYRTMRTFPRYHLLRIDARQRFPRIYSSQQVRTGARYFGPLRSRAHLEQLKNTLERTFGIRPCEYDIQGDDPYPDCLYFQMHTCSRPCNGDIDRAGYLRDVESAIEFIRRDPTETRETILARIRALAQETRFEEAEQVRRQLGGEEKAGTGPPNPIFEVGHFDFVVVMRSRSARYRKIALIRSGAILRLEEHAADTVGETLAASLLKMETAPRQGAGSDYDEFCLAVSFLLRPLRSVRFFPIDDPGETASAVAGEVRTSGEGPRSGAAQGELQF